MSLGTTVCCVEYDTNEVIGVDFFDLTNNFA